MEVLAMTCRQRLLALCAFGVGVSCGPPTPLPAPAPAVPPPASQPPTLVQEEHLTDIRQLTMGGENAEAYWSFDGRELILQARPAMSGCDRIFRMQIGDNPPSPIPVSSGKGATTCSFFLPGDREVIFASTHLVGDAC